MSDDLVLEPLTAPQALHLRNLGVPSACLPHRTAKGRRGADGRFEPDPEGGTFIAFDHPDDLLFWCPRTGEVASWHNLAFALGEEVIPAAATYQFGQSLHIVADPARWLVDSRRAIVVLRWELAFDRLRDAPAIALDEALEPLYRKWMRPRRMPELRIVRAEQVAA